MKKEIFTLGLLTLAACGSEFAGAQTPSMNDMKRAERVAIPLHNARIVDVQNVTIPFSTPGGALGGRPQTDITVEYRVDCMRKFQSFSYAAVSDEGQLTVYTHALVTQPTPTRSHQCLSLTHVQKLVAVNGYFAEDDIKLVQLENAQPVKVTEDIMQIKPAKSVKVSAVRELCPADKMCVINGSVIDLAVEVNGCMDQIGPLSYEIQNLADERTTLTVAASEMTSKLNMVAFCTAGPYLRKVSITLPNVYVNADDLEIRSVK